MWRRGSRLLDVLPHVSPFKIQATHTHTHILWEVSFVCRRHARPPMRFSFLCDSLPAWSSGAMGPGITPSERCLRLVSPSTFASTYTLEQIWAERFSRRCHGRVKEASISALLAQSTAWQRGSESCDVPKWNYRYDSSASGCSVCPSCLDPSTGPRSVLHEASWKHYQLHASPVVSRAPCTCLSVLVSRIAATASVFASGTRPRARTRL